MHCTVHIGNRAVKRMRFYLCTWNVFTTSESIKCVERVVTIEIPVHPRFNVIFLISLKAAKKMRTDWNFVACGWMNRNDLNGGRC